MQGIARPGSYTVPLLLFLSAVCFPLGLVLPLMRLERLFVFEETPSLIDLIVGLHASGDWLLAAVIAILSCLFPAIKILTLFLIAYGAVPGRRLSLLSAMGKWSMTDVMLVAIVIFAAKTSGVATALTLPGLWFFAAATVLSVLAALAIERRARS